jgi:hypothetical protein
MKKSATVGKSGNKQGPKVAIDTPFKDNLFKPWGGMQSATPQHTNKSSKK